MPPFYKLSFMFSAPVLIEYINRFVLLINISFVYFCLHPKRNQLAFDDVPQVPLWSQTGQVQTLFFKFFTITKVVAIFASFFIIFSFKNTLFTFLILRLPNLLSLDLGIILVFCLLFFKVIIYRFIWLLTVI